MPARRFTFADVDGHRHVTAAALVPARRGWNGAMPAPAWAGNEWVGWVPLDALPARDAVDPIARLVRGDPERVEALLKKIATAKALTDQRALIVDALAAAVREETPRAVVFAHPLAITAAARRRFNIGPLAPEESAGPTVALRFDAADWDRSEVMNAPGQSESADSPYFANLAPRWAAGERVPLPFSEAAVRASTASTLTLTPAELGIKRN